QLELVNALTVRHLQRFRVPYPCANSLRARQIMLKRAVQKEGSQPAPKPSQSFSCVASAKTSQASISSKFGVVPSSSPSKDTSTLKSSRTTLLNEKASRFAPSTKDSPPPSSQPQNPKKRPADSEASGLSLKKALCADPAGGFSG